MSQGAPMRVIDHPSPNFDARSGEIEFIVLHYTGMQDGETALARLADPAPVAGRYPGPWQSADIDPTTELARVSAHYVVAEDGSTFRLVDEARRAWHAGRGSWRGRTNLNDLSIGIEIVNGGHDFGLPDFPAAQIDAVIALLHDILARTGLKPEAVIGHSDLAPERKRDPGEAFPWQKLAEAGVSIWPRGEIAVAPGALERGDESNAVLALQRDLAAFGYDLAPTGFYDEITEAIVAAFQRRFRPARIDGVADKDTIAALGALHAERA